MIQFSSFRMTPDSVNKVVSPKNILSTPQKTYDSVSFKSQNPLDKILAENINTQKVDEAAKRIHHFWPGEMFFIQDKRFEGIFPLNNGGYIDTSVDIADATKTFCEDVKTIVATLGQPSYPSRWNRLSIHLSDDSKPRMMTYDIIDAQQLQKYIYNQLDRKVDTRFEQEAKKLVTVFENIPSEINRKNVLKAFETLYPDQRNLSDTSQARLFSKLAMECIKKGDMDKLTSGSFEEMRFWNDAASALLKQSAWINTLVLENQLDKIIHPVSKEDMDPFPYCSLVTRIQKDIRTLMAIKQ